MRAAAWSRFWDAKTISATFRTADGRNVVVRDSVTVDLATGKVSQTSPAGSPKGKGTSPAKGKPGKTKTSKPAKTKSAKGKPAKAKSAKRGKK